MVPALAPENGTESVAHITAGHVRKATCGVDLSRPNFSSSNPAMQSFPRSEVLVTQLKVPDRGGRHEADLPGHPERALIRLRAWYPVQRFQNALP